MLTKDQNEKYKEYAENVVNGKIVAGKYIILACQRFLSFFERDDIYFDCKAVDKVVNFISKLKHFTGSHNGKPFVLEQWQIFIISALYGFKWKKDGLRVTRTAYIEVSRKNGKTALVAALCLYHLIADGEANGQVILAANSAKQASLCFDMCNAFASGIDRKGKFFHRYRDTIKFPVTKSKLEVVSADASRLDGLNASFFVCDELHEAPNSKVWNVLESSQGMRTQPLAVAITTAGFNRSSFCYSMRHNNIQVLRGKKEDDSLFCGIWTLDKEDDPLTNEDVWIKANPNLGVTARKEYLRQQIAKAKGNAVATVNVLTKLFNKWVSSSEEWIAADKIVATQSLWKYEDFADNYAYMGVDLGATSDLTAVSVMIPTADKYFFRNYYFLPSSQLKENANRELYIQWAKQGHLIVCPGNVTDYEVVLRQILKINDEITVVQVGYDQWNATSFATTAEENGMNLIPYSMSIGSLNRPTKELARLILSDKVVLYDNPIDNFCFSNVVIKRDYNDNERPTKESRENKIDGVVAMIMALGTYLTAEHYDGSVMALNYE